MKKYTYKHLREFLDKAHAVSYQELLPIEQRLLWKLAVGYPPFLQLFKAQGQSPFRPKRAGLPFTDTEKKIIDLWYTTNKDSYVVKEQERRKSKPRTKNLERPPVWYLCLVLQRSENELKRHVLVRYCRPGLTGVLCAIPEWR